MMFSSLVNTIQYLIHTYGLLALFIYLTLETGLVLHFVPSEIIVPFAAAELITPHDPISYILFVVVATAGATTGAVFPYLIFRRYGRPALERYGRYIHVTSEDIDRSEGWFKRWGESSILWGRVLPVLRASIAIPAGLAEMDLRKYTIYSAAGAAAYNTIIAYLTVQSESATSPLGKYKTHAIQELTQNLAAYQTHPLLAAGVGLLVLAAAAWVWVRRDTIRKAPIKSLYRGLWVGIAVGLISSSSLIFAGLTAPTTDFYFITSIWNDPLIFLQYGASPQIALFITGGIGLLATGCLYVVTHFLFRIHATLGLLQEHLFNASP